ncbi:zinc finger E-box-binding homeobox 1 [Diprion similis]|uniref:zinc finger E-box-binding homeobox 1 n=1 Tax=Diprion similis TaxID=362088 RepID=UPI001EF91536|nr:zinc finger E-box-binding homeobox 1 [Diprion similis]
MDITEAFAPGGGNEDLGKTDFFDFVVSPAPHGASGDGVSDEEGFLHRSACRSIGVSFLDGPRHQDTHDLRHDLHGSPFVKETNNNTLTALPPVSTITGSLTHHHHQHHNHRSHNCPTQQNADVTMQEQPSTDCDYWGDEGKEQTCSIFLEDLSKYNCWSTGSNSGHGQSHDSIVQSEAAGRGCSGSHRQNTDGAIYTLTVLNNDANSMDALDCCKSPPPPSSDSWPLRPNLDLDAILNLDPANDHEHENVTESSRRDSFHIIPVAGMGSQYSTDDSGFVESKELCVRGGQTPAHQTGDNNNDWKLSDQNHLPEGGSTGDSAESLLRSALQGKLYSGASTQAVSSSSSTTSQTPSLALQGTTSSTPHVQIIADHQPADEAMHPCTEEDLLLSQLDATTYRPGDYEKLKSIANEVVEYCRIEPVCNVSATTTVMYTLDPASGSLGTITLPADLSQMGTVTVVTAGGQRDAVIGQPQTAVRTETEAAPSQIQISPTRAAPASTSGASKPTKKYMRRGNRNGSGGGAAAGGTGNSNGTQQQGSGSPGSVQRKERSLHYCSICSKGFKDKYSVNVHIRTHTGEKPFACSLCGKSFRQKAHLAKHYQTHVAQKPAGVAAPPTPAPTPPAPPAATVQTTPVTAPANGSPAASVSDANSASRSQSSNDQNPNSCNSSSS